MTTLKGYIWEDWVSVHYDGLKALSLTNFLQHFKDAFMPTEWETDVHVKLNTLSQTENQTFCNYSTSVRNVNSLLHGMDSFLNDVKLCTCIEVGMDLTLARCTHACDKKLHLITQFQPWLNALKELDTDIQAEHAEHHAELEAMMKSMQQKSCDDCTLSDPSHKYNTSFTPSKSVPPSNAPSHLGSKDYPPKLTPKEGSFLVNNHGCTKCCKLYVFHMKFECPNNFPKGTRYKAVTQASVDTMQCAHEAKTKKMINTVAPASSNTTMGPSSHLVAAVMGYSLNPVGYPVNYLSAVLSNNEDEDELDSSEVCGQLAAIIKDISDATLDSLNLLKADSEFVAPMKVPHMFWCASTSPPDSLPVQFDCLLDIGSHLVIIHEQLVKDLNLHCHKLQKPIISELTIQPNGPKVLEFHNFIKLKQYDYSGAYIAKTVCTIIYPTLCAPVLLGLPFLKHDSIIIDVDCRTAIDKKKIFDLLHPSPPPTKKSIKPKLKFNFKAHKSVLALCSALLTEMKSTFSTK